MNIEDKLRIKSDITKIICTLSEFQNKIVDNPAMYLQEIHDLKSTIEKIDYKINNRGLCQKV